MERDPAVVKRTYESQHVMTASPEMCVVLLYERLVDDLESAERAFDRGWTDFRPIFDVLFHAQEIVRLLRASMRVDIWPEGANLVSLYNWFERRLASTAMFQEPQGVKDCLPLVRQLLDAWRKAAEKATERDPEASWARQSAFSESRTRIADFLA